ncbi:MAG TPA: hypothetical protein VE988_19930 [Gemmataceae bacterium]|nr:hypothetical protein [Gemmataceae bacterium]
MKQFTVTWVASAQNSLAQLYLDASNPQAVTDAANTIDSLLAKDPLKAGTHVQEELYSLDVIPLRVLYSVSEPDRLVEVASVRRLDPPIRSNGQGQLL